MQHITRGRRKPHPGKLLPDKLLQPSAAWLISGMAFALPWVMKTAIAQHEGRVSPVFDVAEHLLVVDLDAAAETARVEAAITETTIPLRVRRVVELGVEVLLCGGISIPLEGMLTAAGVRVISQVCGPVEDVLEAFVAGRLTQEAFLPPGCRCRRRRRCARGRRTRGRHGQ